MSRLRYLGLIAFFLVLTAVEITHGIFRLETVHDRRRREILAAVERGHDDLAHEARALLDAPRRHAEYLRRTRPIRTLVDAAGGDPPQAAALEDIGRDLLGQLPALLVTFRGIDRIRILGASGRELFRCERTGAGVGVVPADLLRPHPETSLVPLMDAAGGGGVVVSALEIDAERVEVSRSARHVFHYVTGVAGETRTGFLVLTVFAAPLADRIRGSSTVDGAWSELVDAAGRTPDGDRPWPELDPSVRRSERDDGVAFSSPISDDPGYFVVTVLPAAAEARALAPLRGEFLWIIAAMAATTMVLMLAAIFFLRLSHRAHRMREAEQRLERVRRESQLERLRSLGMLTAGVAHEINNPLEGIGNYLALLARRDLDDARRVTYVERVRHGFDRIRDLVRDLLRFGRPGGSVEAMDFGDVVERAVGMIRFSEELRDVTIEREGLDGPLPVQGDPGRLEQVVLNLLLNAGRAMEGRGLLRLAASRRACRGEPPMVELTVRDTGPGIPPEDLPRIFDPFFSGSGGTGLGLAISFETIQAHGGSLTARNPQGGGAELTVRLPLATESAEGKT